MFSIFQPKLEEVKAIEVERPFLFNNQKIHHAEDHFITSNRNTPIMSKYVENFRNAPPRSRAERLKEDLKKHSFKGESADSSKCLPVKDSDSFDQAPHGNNSNGPLFIKSSKEPTFGNTSSKPKMKIRGIEKSNPSPEQEDELEVLNKRIADVLSQSESLTASNSFSLSNATETSCGFSDLKSTDKDMSSRQVAAAKIHPIVSKTAPLRKEDDILYQWRLRRKVESAKRGTQFMIAEKEYESDGKSRYSKSHGGEQKDELVNPNSKVDILHDYYKSRTEENLNLTLTELRQKLRFNNPNLCNEARESSIINAVEQTLKQGPLLEMEKKAVLESKEPLPKSSHVSISHGEDVKSKSCKSSEETPKRNEHQIEPLSEPFVPPTQAATTTTQTETHSSSTSVNPVFPPNPFPMFPYFYPHQFNGAFMHQYLMPPQFGNAVPGFFPPVNQTSTSFNSAYSQMECNLNPLSIPGNNFYIPHNVDRQMPQSFSAKKSDHPSRLMKKVPSKRSPQLTSIDSTLTTISSLDVTQDFTRMSIEKGHPKVPTAKSSSQSKELTLRLIENKVNQIDLKGGLECLPKRHADSLMWSKCEKRPTLPRFERVDFKLHYVCPETADQGCKVPNYLHAKPVNIQLNDPSSEIENLSSVPTEGENYPSDPDREPHGDNLHGEQSLEPKSDSVRSSSHSHSIPEVIDCNQDSLSEDNEINHNLEVSMQKDSTLTLTVDAEIQTEAVQPNEGSSISRKIQLVEQLNLSCVSVDVGTQTADTNLVDDETQTTIDHEPRDITLASVEKRHLESSTDDSEQEELQDNLIDVDIEEILRNEINDDDDMTSHSSSEKEDLTDMKKRLRDAYAKACLQKENLEKLLSSFDD